MCVCVCVSDVRCAITKREHIYVKVRSITDKLCQVEQFTKECCNKRCTEQLNLVINNIEIMSTTVLFIVIDITAKCCPLKLENIF